MSGIVDGLNEKGASLKVVIIDACRNNPFAPPPGKKSVGLGRLVRVTPPAGTFVVFSAGEGQTALDRLSVDDPERNGVFTRVFAPMLRADITLQDAIKATQEEVVALAESINEEQTPAYYDEVIGNACLSDTCSRGAAALPIPSKPTQEAERSRVPVLSLQLEDAVDAVAFSPDGRFLATTSNDRDFSNLLNKTHHHAVQLWDAASGELIRTLESVIGRECSSLSFSSDSKRIIVACDHGAQVWEIPSGRRGMSAPSGSVLPVPAFIAGQATIVSGGRDGTVTIWSADDGQKLNALKIGGDGMSVTALSPDGLLVAGGDDDDAIKVWSLGAAQSLFVLRDHTDVIRSIAFSADGERLVSTSADKTAKVWDARNGDLLRTLEGHGDEVMHAAYTPDGRLIATASRDNTARIWDAATGRPLRTIDRHKGFVNWVAFSPDGRRLVTGSGDRTAKVWDIGDLADGAAGVAGK